VTDQDRIGTPVWIQADRGTKGGNPLRPPPLLEIEASERDGVLRVLGKPPAQIREHRDCLIAIA
jgi:hypothetical protein